MAAFGSTPIDADLIQEAPPQTNPTEFRKGLRAGMLGAESQLHSLAGGVGAAAGFDRFAAARNAQAQRLAEEAQAVGPRVGSLKQIGGLRDALDYGAGVFGQAVPSVALGLGAGAATVLSGGGALAGLLAAGAVQAPLEIGDVLQRQQQDPTARLRGAGENLRDAVLFGGASALGQGIVPGAVGGKLVGAGVRGGVQAAKRGIGRAVLKNAAIEGLSEGSGEALKQQGVKPGTLDWEPILENVVAGGLVGGPQGGVGHVADTLHGAPSATFDRVKELGGKVMKAGTDAAQGVDIGALKKPVTDFAANIRKAAEPQADTESVLASQGLTPEETQEVQAADPTAARARLLELANKGVQATTEAVNKAASWLAKRSDLSPEDRAQVDKVLSGAADDGAKAWVAAKEAAIKGKDKLLDGVDKGLAALEESAGKAAEKLKKRGKASEDYSDVRQQIVEAILPHVPPTIQSDGASMNRVGEFVRQYIDAVQSENYQGIEAAARALKPVLGENAESVLARVYDIVGSNEPEATQRFLKGVARDRDINARADGLRATIEKNLPDTWKGNADDLADGLTAWARGGRVANNADLAGAAHEGVRFEIDKIFGDKAPKIYQALEQHVLDENRIPDLEQGRTPKARDADDTHLNEENDEFPEAGTENEYFGKGNDRTKLVPFESIESVRRRFPAAKETPGDQLIKQLQERYPDREVHFVPMDEAAKDLGWSPERVNTLLQGKDSKDYGLVATRKSRGEDKLGDGELKTMRMDRGREGSSKSAVKFGETTYDAVKIAKRYLGEDHGTTSGDARLARAFFQGVSQLTTQFGVKPQLSDDLVIGYTGGKPMTFGEAKTLSFRDVLDGMRAKDAQILANLREDYADARRDGNAERMESIRKQATALLDKESERVGLDQARGEGGDRAHQALVEDMLNGRQEVDPAGNIHELEATNSVTEIKHNADATPRVQQASSRSTVAGRAQLDALRGIADKIDGKSAYASKVAKQVRWLAGRVDVMSEADRGKFMRLGADFGEGTRAASSATELGAVTAPLVQKYAEVLRKPVDSAKEPARPAEREEAAPQRSANERAAAFEKALQTENYEDAIRSADDIPAMREYAQERYKQLRQLDRDSDGDLTPEQVAAYGTLKGMMRPTFDWDSLSPDFGMEGTQGPKAQAAKQAALLQAASSSDPALLEEVRSTNDAGALQRSVNYLNEQTQHYEAFGGVVDALRRGDLEGMRRATDELADGQDEGTTAQLDAVLAGVTRAMGQTKANEAIWNKLQGSPAKLKDVLAAGYEHMTADQQVLSRALVSVVPDYEVRMSTPDNDSLFGVHVNDGTDKYIGLSPLNAQHIAAQTLLHEAVHAATVRGIVENLDTQKALVALMADVAKVDPSIREEYGYKDALEFVSEAMANPAFQERLKAAPASRMADVHAKNAGLTLWDKFVDLIRSALGLKDRTALDQAIEFTSAVMRTQYAQGERASGVPYSRAVDAMNERLDKLVQDPDVAYSLARVDRAQQGPIDKRSILKYIHTVLGDSVQVAWDDIMHAGEFGRGFEGDVIRLSVHALNPKSVAYHEALHAFAAQLRDAKETRIYDVLKKAAGSKQVLDQMRSYFRTEPSVLKQINTDPEEAVAYMYQLWAQGDLKVNPQATTVMGKIGEFLRQVLGIWSNSDRALHILEHFHSGEYAKNIGKPNVTALLAPGRNAALDAAAKMTEPLRRLGNSIFGAGGARMRDTGNEALTKIADLIHPAVGAKGDEGYISASRTERATRMNRLAMDLAGVAPKHLSEALEALQLGKDAASPEARLAQRTVYKHLRSTLEYMHENGVKVSDLGEKYFPRVWDPSILMSKSREFLAMMDKYVANGQYDGDPAKLLNRLIGNEGNEFDVDPSRPGAQFMKERVLKFITGEDAQPFLSKDFYRTLDSYIAQATRRTEWAKRFGADGETWKELISQAMHQGATDEQVQLAERYRSGIIGSLGDNISPEARRLMGNVVVYQNIRLLPLAIFSSIVDPMGIIVNGGTVGDAFSALKRGIREIPRNFKGVKGRDAATELAETLGTIDDATLMHTVGTMYNQGMVGDTARKINDTFFRFNLMEQFNQSMRVGATEAAVRFIQRHAELPERHSERWLSELGLTARDVKAGPNGRIALTEADGLTPEQAEKMRAAVNRWVDGAVLRPNSADKPIWFNDPHFMLFSHLKQFTYSFHHTIIKRVVHEWQHGNYRPAMALGSYVPIMIASDAMKGLIQGGGDQPAWKRDWNAADYAWSGVQRAGLLGVGQFGVDAWANVKHGGTGVGALVGPTFEQLGEAAQVAGGRERFNKLALDSMPANALYAGVVGEK